MDNDYSILEKELTSQLSDLKRELHMKSIKRLFMKQQALAKLAVQRKQIKQLEEQILEQELEPTVSMVYSPHHNVKDNQMKGYLVYLLQVKEFYSREVETKKEIIRQREEQIKKLNVKLCAMQNEYSKKKRAAPRKAPEFVLLDNMSNKMNQMQKRVSSVKQENKEIRENIMDLQISLKQYKKSEKEIRKKIDDLKDEAQMHLDDAVSTYEEREECINRTKMYQDRCSHDLKTAEINENALSLIYAKTKNFEDFEQLQKKERSDSRIATTEDLIEQGITGLEPELNIQERHLSLVASSGRATPEEMDEHFKLTDDQANSKFSYLEELLEMIHRTQNTIDELKKKNRELLMSMSERERRLRWEIEETKANANKLKSEADAATESVTEARADLDRLLEQVRSLYLKCGLEKRGIESEEEKEKSDALDIPEERGIESEEQKEKSDALDIPEESGIESEEQKEKSDALDIPEERGIEEVEINDSNALEFIEEIEKKIVEYLMLIEYSRMKENVQEDIPERLIPEGEGPIIEEPSEEEYLDTIQPRLLRNKPEPRLSSDLQSEDSVLSLDELKSKAVAAVAEIESGERSEDDDSMTSRKGRDKS